MTERLSGQLARFAEMAAKNRKADDPLQGETGTGEITSIRRHVLPKGLAGRKIANLGMGEYTRGGPGSRSGTREKDLRDFGQSHS